MALPARATHHRQRLLERSLQVAAKFSAQRRVQTRDCFSHQIPNELIELSLIRDFEQSRGLLHFFHLPLAALR